MKQRIRAIAAGVVFCGVLQAVALASASWAQCQPAVPKTGDVLIAGGDTGNGVAGITAAAEIFDPMTESFASECNMTAPRAFPQLLVVSNPTDRILVVSGLTKKQEKTGYLQRLLKTTDSFNPLTGEFTKGPNMQEGAESGVAVELEDGRSLVTVGLNRSKSQSSNLAMIYDPVTNKFTTLKRKMISPRYDAAAALINGCSCANEGKVLIAGGVNNLSSAELFDPATNSFSATGNMNVARTWETATSLTDGTILIAGGLNENGVLNSAEIYDPSTGTFAFTATPMIAYRQRHTATRLEDGTVLIAGGLNPSEDSISSAEIYNPKSGTFVLTAQPMNTPRYYHSATLLSGTGALSGWVLISGGENLRSEDPGFAKTLDTAELFNPTDQTFTLTTGNMLSPHEAHAAALLP